MLLMAIATPVALNLVSKSQDVRNRAMEAISEAGGIDCGSIESNSEGTCNFTDSEGEGHYDCGPIQEYCSKNVGIGATPTATPKISCTNGQTMCNEDKTGVIQCVNGAWSGLVLGCPGGCVGEVGAADCAPAKANTNCPWYANPNQCPSDWYADP
ncbi:MAG: hypothetical protein WCT01_05035, partial [Candidatus Shapirobacteria bacterium]